MTPRPQWGRWTRRRRFVQCVVALVFAALPISYLYDQRIVFGTLSSLSVGPISLIDPATGVATVLASRSVTWALLGGMLLPILAALALGPIFCSWICPWGLLSETIAGVLRKRRAHAGGAKASSALRWSVLAAALASSWLFGVPLVALFSAPGSISSLPLEWFVLGGVASGTLIVVGALLLVEIFLPRRIWCRALCPVGSTLVLLRTPRTLMVRSRDGECGGGSCQTACAMSCPWDLDPRKPGIFSGCTNCGRCLESCPSSHRLDFGFGKPRRKA